MFFLLFDPIGQFHNEGVSHRDDSQITGHRFQRFGIELLILTARNIYRSEADGLASGNHQLVIAYPVAVAPDIKDSIFPFVAGKLRFTAELFGMLEVFGCCLGKSFELFGNDLALSLR